MDLMKSKDASLRMHFQVIDELNMISNCSTI